MAFRSKDVFREYLTFKSGEKSGKHFTNPACMRIPPWVRHRNPKIRRKPPGHASSIPASQDTGMRHLTPGASCPQNLPANVIVFQSQVLYSSRSSQKTLKCREWISWQTFQTEAKSWLNVLVDLDVSNLLRWEGKTHEVGRCWRTIPMRLSYCWMFQRANEVYESWSLKVLIGWKSRVSWKSCTSTKK